MSYVRRVGACNNVCFEQLLPWFVDGTRYGWVDQAFAACLRDYPAVFTVGESAIRLHEHFPDYRSRTEAVNQVMLQLHQAGVIDTWVGEAYPVLQHFAGEAVLEIERAAASFLGIRSFGVHVNGLVRRGNDIMVWVGIRSHAKPFWPGKLDQLVAGGQPVGISLLENVVKEAAEEAAIPPQLAQQAQAVGQIHYQHQGQRGLENSTLFLYDLWLPEDFIPQNNDGEVDGFRLLPLSEIAHLTEYTEDFKANCNLVNIDLLLRNNVITAAHPDYAGLTAALYQSRD